MLKPGLNLTRDQFSFLCSKASSQKTEPLFKFSNLNSNLALTLGYLNPALNTDSALAKS